jgi:hypothetical protein
MRSIVEEYTPGISIYMPLNAPNFFKPIQRFQCMKVPFLSVYTDRPHRSLDLENLLKYLRDLGFSPELKGDFFEANPNKTGELEVELARCRLMDLTNEGGLNLTPKKSEIDYEKSISKSQDPIKLKRDFSNVYEGFTLARLLRGYVKGGVHILFTSRMFASFGSTRYHGRTIILDFPLAVISTTGIVEAPARPREFYIKQAAYHRAKQAGLKVPDESEFMKEVYEEYGEQFIDYDDSRMTEASKGQTLQAIFYLFFGEAFCERPDCRLHNAHTQEALIHAQIDSARLCDRHFDLLVRFKIGSLNPN